MKRVSLAVHIHTRSTESAFSNNSQKPFDEWLSADELDPGANRVLILAAIVRAEANGESFLRLGGGEGREMLFSTQNCVTLLGVRWIFQIPRQRWFYTFYRFTD